MMKHLISILFCLLFLVQPAMAQDPQPIKVYLPVILTSLLNPDNNWRIIQPVASTNYVLNPSGEIAGNFAAVGGSTVTRVTTYQKYGLYSYRVQTAADNEGASFTLSALTNANHTVSMRVRGTLPAAWDWSLDNAVYNPPRLIEKIDQNWNLYSLHFQASEANGSTTLYIRQNGAGAGDFYIDGVQVEPLDYWTTYIDGTQDGCGWLGTAHASISERSGESRAGGKSVNFWDEYNFQIQRVIGAGAVTHTLGVDNYAILPGGELNSDKVQPREFQIIGKFIAETEADVLEKKAALESAFYTTDRQLTRVRFNGGNVQKELAVRYKSGLEGDLAAFYGNVEIVEDDKYMEHALYTEKAAIQVVAPYPYWQEVGESAATPDTNDSATFRLVAGRLRSTGQWDALGPPAAPGTAVYNHVYALAEDDTYLYIGGDFLNWNNDGDSDYIVRYNKQTGVYSSLGTGMNGVVWALTIGPDGTLYAGGAFTTAGGGAANYVAAWDPVASAWSALGAGTDNIVYTLAIGLDGTLYVGGSFLNAGGGGANRVAKWNGAAWSTLGAGTNNVVLALAINPGTGYLVAGGGFTTAGGGLVNFIAQWDGAAWSDLDGGMDNPVQALAYAPDGLLYATGFFTTAGSISANYVASWNDTAWSALGSGLDAEGYALEVGADNTLYIGGIFASAGGLTINDRIVRWNGFSYAPMDIDLPGVATVWAVLTSNTDPVIPQNYNLWLGFNTTGTGYFAGLTTIDNEGTVQAFPKIVYSRSGGTSAILETLRNERNGKEILFDYGLLDGETLTIDLMPTKRSIVSSMFGSRMDAYLAGSDFGQWSLLPNNNDVTSFVAEGGGPTVTSYMLWREAFSSY